MGNPDFGWRSWLGEGQRAQIDGVRVTVRSEGDDSILVEAFTTSGFTIRITAPDAAGADDRAAKAAVAAVKSIEQGE